MLDLRLSSSNIYAAETSVNAYVNCDAKWTVTPEEGSWARVEDLNATPEGGTFKLCFAPNTAEESRSTTVVAKSGSMVYSFVLTQGGAATFFNPRSISISGTNNGVTNFVSPSPWTAEITEGKDWLSLKGDAGTAGSVSLVCIPADANENIGPRNAVIKVHIGEAAFDVPVVQGQTDVIYLAQDAAVEMPYEGGEFTVNTSSNVSYRIVSSADWVKHLDTKALDEAEEQFVVEPNPGIKPRTASIAFRYADINTSISVIQEGHDPILDSSVPALNGVFGYNCVLGAADWSQSYGRLSPDGDYTYMFMSSKLLSVYEIGGIKLDAEKGDSFDITLTTLEKTKRSSAQPLSVTVVKADDSLMWLRGGDYTWMIIEKP